MILYENFIKIKPMPYPYPRKAPDGTIYIPNDYKLYKAELAKLVAKDYECLVYPPHYAVELKFHLATPKYTSKNAGDLDNLAKGVLDALQGVIWVNDAQITQLVLSKYPSLKYGIYILAQGFN